MERRAKMNVIGLKEYKQVSHRDVTLLFFVHHHSPKRCCPVEINGEKTSEPKI